MPEPRYDPSDPVAIDMEDALTMALKDQGIDEAFRQVVRRYVEWPGDEWRVCCNTGCDPCVQQILRAVDQVRKMVRWMPVD